MLVNLGGLCLGAFIHTTGWALSRAGGRKKIEERNDVATLGREKKSLLIGDKGILRVTYWLGENLTIITSWFCFVFFYFEHSLQISFPYLSRHTCSIMVSNVGRDGYATAPLPSLQICYYVKLICLLKWSAHPTLLQSSQWQRLCLTHLYLFSTMKGAWCIVGDS